MAQINWNNWLPIDSRKVLGSGLACLVVLAGACWGLFSFGYIRGKDIGQDELAAYKATSEARLPEITAGLTSISKKLIDELDIFSQNQKLEAENSSFQKQLAEAAKTRAELDVTIEDLKDQLKAAADKEQQLHDEITKYTGNTRHFTVTENNSEIMGEGHSIGVSGGHSTSEIAVVVDNKKYGMAAGNSVPIEFKDRICLLTLTSLTWYPASGDFDLSCRSK